MSEQNQATSDTGSNTEQRGNCPSHNWELMAGLTCNVKMPNPIPDRPHPFVYRCADCGRNRATTKELTARIGETYFSIEFESNELPAEGELLLVFGE